MEDLEIQNAKGAAEKPLMEGQAAKAEVNSEARNGNSNGKQSPVAILDWIFFRLKVFFDGSKI